MATATIKLNQGFVNSYFPINSPQMAMDYLKEWSEPEIEQSLEQVYSNADDKLLKRISRNLKNRKLILTFTENVRNRNILPSELKELTEEIEFSKEILNLRKGWDGFDAPAIPKEVYNSSIDFLMGYSKFILKNTGVIINTPEINPGRNGNIHLSWRTTNARMAISIEKSENNEVLAYYYGDLKEDKYPIKGDVPVDKISDFLAFWMKNLV